MFETLALESFNISNHAHTGVDGGKGENERQVQKSCVNAALCFGVDEISVACSHFRVVAKHEGPHVPPGKSAKCHGKRGRPHMETIRDY